MARLLEVAEGVGKIWVVPMMSPQTRIRYDVNVAAETEVEAVSFALAEFPYLHVDNSGKEEWERNATQVNSSKHGGH